MGQRKGHSSVPRHKRMARRPRLQAAKHWIPKYTGKNLVRGYAKHFAVDLLCAVKELEMLGYQFDFEYMDQLKKSINDRINQRQQRKMRNQANPKDLPFELDGRFLYIAGYTSGGVPYGVTWEEMVYDRAKEINFDGDGLFLHNEDEELPF